MTPVRILLSALALLVLPFVVVLPLPGAQKFVERKLQGLEELPDEPSGRRSVVLGYNLVTGDPLNRDGADPGFSSAVFDLDGASVQNFAIRRCTYDATTRLIETSQDSLNSLRVNYEQSASAQFFGLAQASFSLSATFTRLQMEMSQQNRRFAESVARCEIEHLNLDSSNSKLSPTFIEAVARLPTEASDQNIQNVQEQFIERFGTHFFRRLVLGGMFGVRFEFSSDQFESIRRSSQEISVSIEVAVNRAFSFIANPSGSQNLGVNRENSLAETVRSESTGTSRFFEGPAFIEDDLPAWEQAVRAAPVAIGAETNRLEPLANLLTSHHFPDDPQIGDKFQVVVQALNQMCSNVPGCLDRLRPLVAPSAFGFAASARPVHQVAWTRDDSYLVSGLGPVPALGGPSRVSWWSKASCQSSPTCGELQGVRMQGDDARISPSPDGMWVAISDNQQVRLQRANPLAVTKVRTLQTANSGTSGSFVQAAWSPDSRFIATATNGTLMIIEVLTDNYEEGELVGRQTSRTAAADAPQSHRNVRKIVWSPSLPRLNSPNIYELVVATADRVQKFDFNAGRRFRAVRSGNPRTFPVVAEGTEPVGILDVDWRAGVIAVARGGRSRARRGTFLLSAESLGILLEADVGSRAVSLSHDGGLVAVAILPNFRPGNRNAVQILRADTRSSVETHFFGFGDTRIDSLAFSHDGNFLAIGQQEGGIEVKTTVVNSGQFCTGRGSTTSRSANICCGACDGVCGGSGCGRRSGGPSQCCASNIMQRGTICRTSGANVCVIPSR